MAEFYLRVPSGKIYEPLTSQEEFHSAVEKYRWYVGGVGCVAAETLIEGVPAAERAAGTVTTLFGAAAATATYLKGTAPLYRVVTRSGRAVTVTDGHRFLTPAGWYPLRRLRVGDVIAADGSEHGHFASRTEAGFRGGCSSGLRRCDGLPSPEEVAVRDILQQLHTTGGGGSAWGLCGLPSTGCCAFWDEITAISWVRDGQFYDLTVQDWCHYSAHGLWHHNSGKTVAGCVESLLTAMEYPGSVGLIGRWNYRELHATTWATMKAIVPRALVANIVESPQKCYIDVRAPGGKISRVYGWHLSNIDSIYSLTLDWFYIDEGGQIPGKQAVALWKMLEARLRGDTGPLRGWVTGNPNGRDWLWRLFVGRGFRGYRCVRAPTSQNKHLPDGYEQQLRRTASAEWARRFLDAEFNEFEGAILWNYSEAASVFDAFPIPAHWPRYMGLDPGISDPCAALLIVADEAGNLFVMDEYYETGKTISEQCQAILKMAGGARIEWVMIDPTAKSRETSLGKSRLDLYREGGLPVVEGNNRVLDSIAVLQQLCAVDPERVHPITGVPGAPTLYIARHCRHLREELSAWRWGPHGKPMDGDDHAIAALRYAVMRRPQPAQTQAVAPMRPSAREFWESVAAEAVRDLPRIGAGPGGRMAA